MIHREDRSKLASALKQLAIGKITNDEYQDLVLDLAHSSDASVAKIASETYIGVDHISRTYRFIGKDALSKRGRREIANWILFLKSDFEMKTEKTSAENLKGLLKGIFHVLLTLITCGLYLLFLLIGSWLTIWYKDGLFRKKKKISIWPFKNLDEFNHARKRFSLGSGRN